MNRRRFNRGREMRVLFHGLAVGRFYQRASTLLFLPLTFPCFPEHGLNQGAFFALMFPVALDRVPVQLFDQIRLILVHDGSSCTGEYTRRRSRAAAPVRSPALTKPAPHRGRTR